VAGKPSPSRSWFLQTRPWRRTFRAADQPVLRPRFDWFHGVLDQFMERIMLSIRTAVIAPVLAGRIPLAGCQGEIAERGYRPRSVHIR
jgi:hypothetical protein